MSDIVERLRNGWIEELSDYELCQAADEIERLRKQLEESGSEVWYWIARCHSAIGLLPDEMIIGEIQKAAREAETKIERLREALRGVIRVPDKAALDAARAALGEGK